MIIYLVRHGEAEPKSGAKRDEERQLTEAGSANVRKVLALAKHLGVNQIGAVASSPLVRARETAKIATSIFGLEDYAITNSLEPLGTPEEVYEELSKLDPSKTVLLVSHQPLVSKLLADILGSQTRIAMPTGSLARIAVDNGLAASGNGSLELLLSSASM